MSFSVLSRALGSSRTTTTGAAAVRKFMLTGSSNRSTVVSVQSRSITDYMRDRNEKTQDNITEVSLFVVLSFAFCVWNGGNWCLVVPDPIHSRSFVVSSISSF